VLREFCGVQCNVRATAGWSSARWSGALRRAGALSGLAGIHHQRRQLPILGAASGAVGSVPSPASFEAGVLLAKEEREQQCSYVHQLLVAQPKPDCQCDHGISLGNAGRPARWLRVGNLTVTEVSGAIPRANGEGCAGLVEPSTVVRRYHNRGRVRRRIRGSRLWVPKGGFPKL
jgi:hypothetical protein